MRTMRSLVRPEIIGAALLIALCGRSVPAQSNALAIVVIEGEGAVNIIQQKTAVRALVEVRDRNNLPVSGVAVTFSVGGQGASFAGGASTLTVTSNAAGQAVVAGLTPTAAGPVTINASALVNGQTIAATITQTNFATVAEAAASGASAGGGSGSAAGAGGGAGGGGLGTGAIVGIVAGGAAVAAGAVAGAGLLEDIRKPGVEGRGPPCVFTFTPADTSISVPAAGATLQITIAVSPTPCENATWTATSGNATFVTVNPGSGNGNGTVTVTIPPFTQATAIPRTFNVAIAFSGQKIFQFTQAGGGD